MTDELDDQKPMRGLDEYWAMVVRRRWWILGPLFLGWLIVFASAWIIPPKYTSETVVLVEQQKDELDDQKPMRGLDEYWAMVVRWLAVAIEYAVEMGDIQQVLDA